MLLKRRIVWPLHLCR